MKQDNGYDQIHLFKNQLWYSFNDYIFIADSIDIYFNGKNADMKWF